MLFSRLKISTKLIISSAVFLIPIGLLLFFVTTITIGRIRKGMAEHEAISTLKPAATILLNVPEYLNVYMGLKPGNLFNLDNQINSALRTMDRELRSYETQAGNFQGLQAEWEELKKIDINDEEIIHSFMDFAFSMVNIMNTVGEHSGLILVSDMTTYLFVNPVLSSIPESSMRLFTIGNIIRRNLFDGEAVIERWNNDLAIAQEQGRRLAARPFEGQPRDITVNMFIAADIQIIRNNRSLFDSDRDRISSSILSAMEESRKQTEDFLELNHRLEQYLGLFDTLSDLYDRSGMFGITNPATADEFLDTISLMNTYLCELWNETFEHLDMQIQQNSSSAQIRLILYLLIVLVTLGFAFGFVVFILLDINRSVKTLKTLFKGLNENDLTLSLQINSMDEFGELMTAFNGFLDILRSTFGSFKVSSQLVADSVFDISSSSKEITTTANEQSASVSEIVSTMESSKNLSEQIALKTTEVANLAIETQDLSSKGAELREANQSMMEDILKQNQKIISEIRNLSDMIIRISEAIRIIDSIADQTKLIAFNASLEASSSGEAGARFSVVASEIRRFADNVVESTHEIKQKIEEVQGASQTLITEANSGSKQIEIGYERMSEQRIVFEHIVDNSQNVATRSQQISNLSKQQELASTQIFSALKEISAGVKQFVVATSSTSKIADSLNEMSEELKGKVEKYRTES